MKVREAAAEDKLVWDSFINNNDGDFQYYFDWKPVNESFGIKYTLLMIENDSGRLIGICPLKYKKTRIIIEGNKIILFSDGIAQEEKSSAFSALFEYLGKNGAAKFSSLSVFLEGSQNAAEYSNILLKQGFFIRTAVDPGLPCSHVLPLKSPFIDNIYKGLWSQKLRQRLNKVARSDIVVIEDKEFKYLNTFLDMLEDNYKRHSELPPNRDIITAEFNAFRNQTKLFVVLAAGLPVVILRCFYTPTTCSLWQVGSYTRDASDIDKYCYKISIEDACNNGYRYVSFGRSYTEGLAGLKDRFKANRIPVVEYEKTCSSVRAILEWIPVVIDCTIHRPAYLWGKRKVILDMIIHVIFVRVKKERDGTKSIQQASVFRKVTIPTDIAED
jgi:hypothetical protein